MKVILIVIDGLGVGAAPDACKYSDENSNTFKSLTKFYPNLKDLGLYNIEGISDKKYSCRGSYGRLMELSAGKDTLTGHFELAGVINKKPFSTYENGFPASIIEKVNKISGLGALCNKPMSGIDAINIYAKEHIKTKKLIVYTSADSVLQIAAHENVIPLDRLYEICEKTSGAVIRNRIARVIARPFITKPDGTYLRTANRKDFCVKIKRPNMLSVIAENKMRVVGIGKIGDIFSMQDINESYHFENNLQHLEQTVKEINKDYDGLVFVNLVDTDMLYGHRRDIGGYSGAVAEIDDFIPGIISALEENDMLIITSDHGCDPSFIKHTDHTREYVPLLIYGKTLKNIPLGTLEGFDTVSDTVLDKLRIKEGEKSVWKKLYIPIWKTQRR